LVSKRTLLLLVKFGGDLMKSDDNRRVFKST
jgi:hypothetical protein